MDPIFKERIEQPNARILAGADDNNYQRSSNLLSRLSNYPDRSFKFVPRIVFICEALTVYSLDILEIVFDYTSLIKSNKAETY